MAPEATLELTPILGPWHGVEYDAWAEYVDTLHKLCQADPIRQQAELERCAVPTLQDPSMGFLYWLPRYWWLVDKQEQERLCVPNPLQLKYLAEWRPSAVTLKDRRRGASTIIDAKAYWRCRFRRHQLAHVVAHKLDSTKLLWSAIKYGHNQLPDWMRPPTERSTQRELVMEDTGSQFHVQTAGGKGIGRGGGSTVIHLSEIAHYGDQSGTLRALRNSLTPGGWIDLESTAEGEDVFQAEYNAAKKDPDRLALFFPWFQSDENTREPHLEGLEGAQNLDSAETKLAEAYGLSLGQVAWRRMKLREAHGVLQDFLKEHPEDDASCFLSSGSRSFDSLHVTQLRALVEARVRPVDLGGLRDNPLQGTDGGRWTVWRPPREDRTYTIGSDVAEGVPDGDFSHFGVLENETAAQVAEYHGHIDPGELGGRLARVGAWYNNAQVAVERNNHGHAVLERLIRQEGYDALYVHVDLDGGGDYRPGWLNTGRTRALMLQLLRDSFREGTMLVRSALFLTEALHFNERATEKEIQKLKRQGVYRDSLFGWGIALYAWKTGTPTIA